MLESEIALHHRQLWEQFTWALFGLAMLWAVCAVVLLFYRPFATALSLLVLLGGVILLCVDPIAPISWGVLITGFVVHAYSRMSRIVRAPLPQTNSESRNHDRNT